MSWQQAWAASKDSPYHFATGVLGFLPYGVPNPNNQHQLECWQDQFLRDFFTDAQGNPTTNPRHSIRSGHGVAKTCTLAILALWFPLTHYDSKCVVTGASQDQLRDSAWSEIKKWSNQLPQSLRDQIQIDEERLFVKAAPEMAFVVRRTASKERPEVLQGLHAKHVLVLVDEASGVDDVVFEASQGSMSTEGAITVLFSNPTRTSGFFFQTHHGLRHRWRTWHVSSADVPRARGHITDVIETFGQDSNRYRVRVLGEFPTADDETVIPLHLLEEARKRTVEFLPYKPIWGVDVARFGDDTSCLAKRAGNRLIEIIEWRNLDNMQLVGRIVDEWNNTDEDKRPAEILVDVIGVGSGVTDRLAELELPVTGINVAEAASISEKYRRLRDELYFRGRDWFLKRNCIIPNDDEKFIAEASTPTYDFDSSGKIVVESKKDMKARGLKSPNRLDAFLLTFATNDQRKIKLRTLKYRERRSAWAA